MATVVTSGPDTCIHYSISRSHIRNEGDDWNERCGTERENSPPCGSSWEVPTASGGIHSPSASPRRVLNRDDQGSEGSWKLALGTDDHHSPESSSRPKGDSHNTDGSWKLALGTDDHHSSESSSRPKGDSHNTDGSWKLALGTDDHHSSENSSRPKGDSHNTDGSWKLALGTDDHHSSENSSKPKGDSHNTDGSWKLALGTDDHHSSENSSKPKGDSHNTDGSWKLALGTDDHHSSENSSIPKGDSHSWMLALGSDSPVLDKGVSLGTKGVSLGTKGRRQPPLSRPQDKGCSSSDDDEEFGLDDCHLSPVLDGRDSHGSWKLAPGEDDQHSKDGLGDGDDGNELKRHDMKAASPVLNSVRRDLHGKRRRIVESDDSEDELRLCIDEDSAKEE